MRQAQILFVQFQQMTRQPQPRQMPVRTLTAGDQYHKAIRQMIEEKLQATVEHRPLGQMVIIQHQQQRRTGGQVHSQLVEQAVEPFFKGKGLMTLAHFQQAQGLGAELREELLQTVEQAFEETPGVVIPWAEAQPQALPMGRQALAELHRQRTLAKPSRCADQQQPPFQPGAQAFAQARAQHIAVRQWWPVEATFQGRDYRTGRPLDSGQISHRRALVEGCCRHCRCPQTSGKSRRFVDLCYK